MLFWSVTILLITYIAWLPYYKNPLYQDQSAHYYIGCRWLEGKIPYRDLRFGPGPHLALIYAVFSKLTKGNEFIINFLSAGYVGIGNISLFHATNMVYDLPTAFTASILYAFYMFNPRLIGNRFPPESYSIPLYTVAFYFLLLTLRESSPFYALLCGLSIGAATLVRQSAFFYFPLFLFFTFLFSNYLLTIILFLSFAAPHILWICYFAYKKALRQYLESTIMSPILFVIFANPQGRGKDHIDRVRASGKKIFQLLINNSLNIFPLYLLAVAFLIYSAFNAPSTETFILFVLFLTGLSLIFPRKNFDSNYWLNSVPWAAVLGGNTITKLIGVEHPDDMYYYTTMVLLFGLLIFIISIDFQIYVTLDPEKRDRVFDPKKFNHASWWPTFNKIGEYLRENTIKTAKILVLGHAARIYNESRREAFFYSLGFIPFKKTHLKELFYKKMAEDYPEAIVIVGHMPAFPHNPEPYLKDLEEIQRHSGIIYIPRKVIDNFPILFADPEKSYIGALFERRFLNRRLKHEKGIISSLTLHLETNLHDGTEKQALTHFIRALKDDGRLEDLVYTLNAIRHINRFEFSEPEMEYFNIMLGEAQFEARQLKDAENTFLRIIDKNPHAYDARNNLGVIYFEQKKYKEAIKTFKDVLSADPNNMDARENISSILYQLESAP